MTNPRARDAGAGGADGAPDSPSDRVPGPARALRVNLFTAGDSTDVNTWSGVPYHVARALAGQGVEVNRINFLPTRGRLYRFYRRVLGLYRRVQRRVFGRAEPWDLYRDPVVIHLARRKIAREARRHADADFNLFLTYTFSTRRYTRTPVVHLCDMCFEHFLEDTGQKRTLGRRGHIRAEMANLRAARLVFSLNFSSCDFLRERYGLEHVLKFDAGINLDLEIPASAEALLDEKWAARRILFVGRGYRKRGVDILIEAFRNLNERNGQRYRLTIVGISEAEAGAVDRHVQCLHYLDKNDPRQFEEYCRLMRSATLFLMPTREGPLPGVIKEAQLTCTPVIMSRIWKAEQVLREGEDSVLVDEVTPERFADEMQLLLNDEARWREMAREAQRSARRYSWDRSVARLIAAFRESMPAG